MMAGIGAQRCRMGVVPQPARGRRLDGVVDADPQMQVSGIDKLGALMHLVRRAGPAKKLAVVRDKGCPWNYRDRMRGIKIGFD